MQNGLKLVWEFMRSSLTGELRSQSNDSAIWPNRRKKPESALAIKLTLIRYLRGL